jgi:nicotinamide riboside transporter PnuC
MMLTITLLLTALSLLGVWLNIKKMRICFYFWGVSNAGWVWIDWDAGIYAQAGLQAVYFLLSIYGIWEWRRR